jgi:hypothetical protein
MLVAVESNRLALGFEVGAGRVKIGKGRLTLDKLQVHQPTGRVVDGHQQGALRAAILKSPVLAAVDLYQLADAVAPVAVERPVDRSPSPGSAKTGRASRITADDLGIPG